MPTTNYNFTLVLAATELTTELEDALFEAGCDDACLSQTGGVMYLEFDRVGQSRDEAIAAALANVRTAGVQVLRVVP